MNADRSPICSFRSMDDDARKTFLAESAMSALTLPAVYNLATSDPDESARAYMTELFENNDPQELALSFLRWAAAFMHEAAHHAADNEGHGRTDEWMKDSYEYHKSWLDEAATVTRATGESRTHG